MNQLVLLVNCKRTVNCLLIVNGVDVSPRLFQVFLRLVKCRIFWDVPGYSGSRQAAAVVIVVVVQLLPP